MAENLVYGQGTYHRTDMLPDSGDEANNLWARYAMENSEYNYAHDMQLCYWLGTTDFSPNNVPFFAGAIGTIIGRVSVLGGTVVYSVAGTGGTFTSGQSTQTVPLGTNLELGWVSPTVALSGGTVYWASIWGMR